MGLARRQHRDHSSGDIVLAFATGNRGLATDRRAWRRRSGTHDVRMVPDNRMTPLFKATVEATEAAIVNALLAADTLAGRDGITAHALRSRAAARRAGPLRPGPASHRERLTTAAATIREATLRRRAGHPDDPRGA